MASRLFARQASSASRESKAASATSNDSGASTDTNDKWSLEHPEIAVLFKDLGLAPSGTSMTLECVSLLSVVPIV